MTPTMNQISTMQSYPPHVITQMLNNRGAQFIEVGQYERAIKALSKALRTAERLASKGSSISCCCHFCSLDTCILSNCTRMSYNRTKNEEINEPQHRMAQSLEGSFLKHSHKQVTMSEDLSSTCGYLYSKPIYVSEVSLYQGHEMGGTLSLIVIFNLALAHQLTALQRPAEYSSFFQKAMQLYELAYQLQLEHHREQSGQGNSLQFTMIVSNNLSEIHRSVKNHSEHAMCLQHLLSTMMYVIDCRFPSGNIEMEGFFHNTSHLILQKRCANAA